jgi:hypothetical protein
MKILILAAILLTTTHAFAAEVFDRSLSNAELKVLLPKYTAHIQAHAGELPSASDNETIRGAAGLVSNPLYFAFQGGKIVGLQSHTINELIEELESAAKDLRQVTVKDREEAARDLLAGFNGAKEAGRISCQLGFNSESKMATERIVVCKDNRSQAGHGGDNEGFFDVRSFKISIDAKSKEPIAVLSLDHMQAG